MVRGIGRLLCRSVIAATIAVAPRLEAQTVHGVVRDSASQEPVPGAVLQFMDAKNQVLLRALSDGRGSYGVQALPEMQRVRVVRIGFRPRELTLPRDLSGDVNVDVVMTPIPTLLEPVHVRSGASCPRRDDRLAALSLLDQARAALLGSVVAVDARPAAYMVRLRFTSFIDSASDLVDSIHVHTDSGGAQREGFVARRSAADFVKLGFVSDDKGMVTYDGPDAETLLDDQFRDGYCFQLREHDATRPNQIGLGFVAARTKSGRFDIDGTLWIDTVALQLRDIRFDYTNFPTEILSVHPGGSIHFRELANGVVLIDSWSFRLPMGTTDTTRDENRAYHHTKIGVQTIGGAVAAAHWPDGFTWNAPLGAVHLHVVDDSGVAVGGREIVLTGTDYRAVSDQEGNATIGRLLSGPYEILVSDSTLAPVGILLRTSTKMSVVAGDTATMTLKVPSPSEYVVGECTVSTGRKPDIGDLFIAGRVVGPQGKPVLRRTAAAGRRGEDRESPAEDPHAECGALEHGWTCHTGAHQDSVDGVYLPIPSSTMWFAIMPYVSVRA